uniref:PRORP domain-containing protein n=1 Tax=Periophthalmus magnuspinnatus TaxID=409849 RepID=A0A3B4A1M6_9GOBI
MYVCVYIYIYNSTFSLEDQKWEGRWTTISPKGECHCCRSKLESIQLTDEEYQQLKDKVMVNVIQGRDVFNKTTPESYFHNMVISICHLNECMYQFHVFVMFQLLAVVSELVLRGQTVLVLGRKHMLRPTRSWDGNNMKSLQQKAHCFFTENISEDDPFLLYAALHSGNHCRFVSRDLMRDHKACLPDGATKRLFFKWQRGHQLDVGKGKRKFNYDTIVQTSGGSWHIPYDDSEDRSTYEVPQKWLCLTSQH